MVKVGFIGLGTMGGPFATNIIKAGFDDILNNQNIENPQIEESG